MSVLKVGENKHFIIRINIISIKTLAFLINVTDKDPESAQRQDTHIQVLFVTGCNALKEATPLKRNKAQPCSYLHAHILHPCYFTHVRLWWLRGQHTPTLPLCAPHMPPSPPHRCFCVNQRTSPNTGLLAASDEWNTFTRGLRFELQKLVSAVSFQHLNGVWQQRSHLAFCLCSLVNCEDTLATSHDDREGCQAIFHFSTSFPLQLNTNSVTSSKVQTESHMRIFFFFLASYPA